MKWPEYIKINNLVIHNNNNTYNSILYYIIYYNIVSEMNVLSKSLASLEVPILIPWRPSIMDLPDEMLERTLEVQKNRCIIFRTSFFKPPLGKFFKIRDEKKKKRGNEKKKREIEGEK